MPALAYQCASCGGELKFNPEVGKFVCEYCYSEFTKEELEMAPATETQVEQETAADPRDDQEAAMYHCPNCGGDIITDDTTAATQCYYCHSPIVLSGRLGGKFLPKKIIPFGFNRDTAVDKFYAWTKKKFFLPKDFFSTQQIENLTGVYFPYWIIDADSDIEYSATGEKTNSWRTGDTVHTRHRVYSCHREGQVHLEDLVKAALTSDTKRLIENVQPYDASSMESFDMSYLSGFSAQKRDIEQSEIQEEVLQDISYYSKKVVEPTVSGYSSQQEAHYSCNPTHVDWEYGLLPVWTMTYQYKGTLYYFAMNGQDGKICGKLPVDMKKLTMVSSGVAAAVALISTVVGLIL